MSNDDRIRSAIVGHRHNPTFRPGDDWFLNACVGINTGANEWEGYRGGFQLGAEVLLAQAGVDRPEGAGDSWAVPNVDYLVYPICLCARHHIEISLKLATPLAWSIFKRRSPGSDQGLRQPKAPDDRHELLPLWETLNSISTKSDKRLAEAVGALEGIIQDFNKVDPTGQVFRYATSLTNAPHLDGLTHINLQTFANRYFALCKAIDEVHVLVSYLVEEYETGSFTTELDRDQLTDVARRVPLRSNWDSEEFDRAKAEIMAEYGLTSNAFQRALYKIQDIRHLAAKIGIVEPLKAVDAETFEKIKLAAESEFQRNPGISPEECVEISALLKISSQEFPEHFAWHSRPLPKDEDEAAGLANEREWSYLARKVCQRPDRLLAGLMAIGQVEVARQLQKTLSSKFEDMEHLTKKRRERSTRFFLQSRTGESTTKAEE